MRITEKVHCCGMLDGLNSADRDAAILPIAFIFGVFYLEARWVDVFLFLRRGPRNLRTSGHRILRSLADVLVITASQTFNSKLRRGIPTYRDRKNQPIGAHGTPHLRATNLGSLRGESSRSSSPREQLAIFLCGQASLVQTVQRDDVSG